MLTYSILAVPFLLFAMLLFMRAKQRFTRNWWVMVLILVGMTAVFDSLIIYAAIVDYDYSKLLGITIAKAPIEDFAYTIAVALLVPALWKLTASKDSKEGNDT